MLRRCVGQRADGKSPSDTLGIGFVATVVVPQRLGELWWSPSA
jgi:hypothetical protein